MKRDSGGADDYFHCHFNTDKKIILHVKEILCSCMCALLYSVKQKEGNWS